MLSRMYGVRWNRNMFIDEYRFSLNTYFLCYMYSVWNNLSLISNLCFRCVHITDIGIGYISTMLSLSSLYLRWCSQIRDFGLQHLCGMRNLQILSLAGKHKLLSHVENWNYSQFGGWITVQELFERNNIRRGKSSRTAHIPCIYIYGFVYGIFLQLDGGKIRMKQDSGIKLINHSNGNRNFVFKIEHHVYFYHQLTLVFKKFKQIVDFYF